MHRITPQVEQLLRAQGVTDAELDELRRTGRLERRSPDGTSSMSVDVEELGAMEIPPEVLDRMRRLHRFLPRQMKDHVELTTGVDLDGDGLVAGNRPATGQPPNATGSTATPPTGGRTFDGGVPASAHAHVTRSTHGHSPSGSTSSNTDGPFVQQRRGGSMLVPLLVLLAVGAVAYVLLAR